MRKYLLVLLALTFFLSSRVCGQGNQVVNNGSSTTSVNFPGAGCTYNWVNDSPGIGLAASGTGDIPSFTAVNNGSSPVTATITAAPPLSGFAYIASASPSGSISVVNIATKAVVATIPVGRFPDCVAISPNGKLVYVTDLDDNNVLVINTATNQVIATIPAVQGPSYGIAVSPDGTLVYVANQGPGTVTVIDASTNKVISTILIGKFSNPNGLLISPDGSKVYVSNGKDGTVSVINTSTNLVVSTIAVGMTPWGLALSGDGKTLYVANGGSGNVSVIDVTTDIVVSTITVGNSPIGISISPDGSLAYVSNIGDGTVSVINTATGSVTATITVGASPEGVSFSPDGRVAYVLSNIIDNNVSVINTANNQVISTLSIGEYHNSFGNFITGSANCSPFKFTITVNPTPAAPPTITTGSATGTISACAGTASASPQIQQLTVSGSNLTGNITATAPPGGGFEISLTAAGGYGNTLSLVPTAGVVNTVVYVRSSATAPAGSNTGEVTLTATGAVTQNVAVSGIVNALPTIAAVSNQSLTNGQSTAAVNFTGTGNTYNWTNNLPGIGLPASGTGNIAPFTAVNTGTSPIIASITATPTIAGLAYIDDYSNNAVSVINTTTNIQVKSIPVGTNPWGVVVSPDGSRVYITNYQGNSVSVIDTKSNTVIATINVGTNPYGIDISTDGTRIYVGALNGSSISVIDAGSLTVVATIPVSSIYDVAVSADGTRLYAVKNTGQVVVINTTTYSIISTITVGIQPIAAALTPDGSLLYITNSGSSTVSVISTSTNAVVATVPVEGYPTALAISPDGSKVYVANLYGNDISVINTATNTTLPAIPVNTSVTSLSLSSDGSYLYAVDIFGTMLVINTATGGLANSIVVPSRARAFGKFIAPGGCPGKPTQFTITVNPSPAFQPTIAAGTATGTISACQGTASASPQIQQFTVKGSAISGNITAAAPPGGEFEISLAAAGGYGNSLVLSPTAGAVNTIIYVRSAATAASGNITGNVTLAATGATTQNVLVKGVVNALPTVNTVPNQSVTNGASTTAVTFFGTGNTFTWVNDTPGIGLAASGTGNIASFTAINTGNSPVAATITTTPLTYGFAYIANEGSNNVTVVNTGTSAVVTSIPVGSAPIGVASSPDGSRVYVTCNGTISVINTATNTVVSTINTGTYAWGILVSPDGNKLYVAYPRLNSVAVINAATGAVISTIVFANPSGALAISPDGGTLYVGNSVSNTVSVVNTANNAIIATIPVGLTPNCSAISRDGSRVYVTNADSGTLSVINTATNTVIATITVGSYPYGVVVSPDGSRVYVSNNTSASVSVVDAATNTVISTVPAGSEPTGISINSDGSLVYVADNGGNNVSVINTATNTLTATVLAGQAPYSIGNFITPGTCSGLSTNFTITVNPTPAAGPNITSTAATGNNTTCQGTASANPNIQQVAVSATALTGPVSLTAPNGFEISLSPTTGFGNSLAILPVGGTISNVPVYVRLAATASPGSNSGNITGTSPGAKTIEIPVTGTANALPTVNTVAPQTVNNGTPTTAVNFTGTGNTFTWINDTPGIGLAASGTGNISSFNAINTGTTPVTATITATAMSTGFAYVPNSSDGTISVINTATNTVVATIALGSGVLPFDISVSPDGSRVYVTDQGSNSVLAINTATNAVIATIKVGLTPEGILVSPDGSRVYVACQGSNNISVISTITNTVIATFAAGTAPVDVSLSPDGSRLYVSHANGGTANTASVINTATYALIATIAVGGFSSGLAVSPDGSHVYVANQDNNTVSVINTANNTVTATIGVGLAPEGVVISPDGSRVYVSNFNSNSISVINSATNQVMATIGAGTTPFGVSLSADGTLLYVADNDGNTVTVINTITDVVSSVVSVGRFPAAFGNFVNRGTGCASQPTQFTITVNPSPAQTSGIIVSPVSGSITTCQGNTSASPNIEQFTVSGTSLTAPIVLTAPNNFEISLSPGSGYTNTITLPLSSGSVNNTTVYVRVLSTAPSGNPSGNVSLNSTGVQPKKAPVTSTVNSPPTVNAVSPQTFLNGATTTAINITGTGNVYNWTNNTPGIGLPASGTGNVPSFTAVNQGTTPITATITVTPSSSGFAYIANYGSNTVSVINTANNSVAATIGVGTNPWGVAVSLNGSKIYVTNQSSNTVSVIDAATETLTATINVGLSPEGVVVSPDGGTVYVANLESNTISVVNASTNVVASVINVGSNPQGIAVSPDGTRVYVANAQSNTVSVINTTNNTVVANVGVDVNPFGVAVSPDGGTVYATNLSTGTVSVINTATNTLTTTVVVGTNPTAICVSPDGNIVYVSNGNGYDISVISTTNHAVTTINLGTQPDGLSLSSDGTLLYVNNFANASVSVINTATGSVVATISVGQFPDSVGNFLWQGSDCPGVPATFTITIDPSPATSATIVANTVSGAIAACAGTASVSPQEEQFTVAGSKLTGDINAAAPPGFEVSLSAGSGFGSTVTITQSGGNVNNTVIYVRSAATASAGQISGNVVLSSPGATSQDVAVTGVVNELPSVNSVNNQTTANGLIAAAIIFTGTGNVFNWTNDTPGIGLAATGSGNIATFTAINQGNIPITATVTVTPGNTITGCTGAPVTFAITVDPTPPTAVTATGVLTPLTTPYGTPSSSETFSVSGISLTSGILVTPPAGFELSTDNVNFSASLTIGSGGNISAQTVYIRLAAITPVGGYSGNIQVTSTGAAEFDMAMPLSTVTPVLLAIIADDKSKTFGAVNPPLTATFVGFVNFETVANLTNPPLLATAATTNSPVGQYPITVGGALSPNYTISYINGTLTIEATEQSLVIPNTFTPNGDGVNDTWDIKYLDLYVNCSVDIFTRWGQKVYSSVGYNIPWDGTYRGSALPVGTYYYIINLKNGLNPLSGFVALIR